MGSPPEGLGNFKVMVQGKGISLDKLWGFSSGNPHQTRIRNEIRFLVRYRFFIIRHALIILYVTLDA